MPSLGLVELLDRLQCAEEAESRVTLGAMLEAIGRRSFGPLLLVPGLVMIFGIPILASLCGLVAAMISLQLLFGRHSFWLPHWALRLGIPGRHFQRGLRWLRPIARTIDRFTQPRLTGLVQGRAVPAIATLCAIMGMVVPALEVIPLADTVVGAGLAAFGMALVAEDGVLALIAVVLDVVGLGLAALGARGLVSGSNFFSHLF